VLFASSRELSGQALEAHVPGCASRLAFEDLTPAECAAREVDAFVLAPLPELAPAFALAIDASAPRAVIVDVSRAHVAHDRWVYGHPERARGRIEASRRIGVPGAYASAFALAAEPILPFTSGPLHGFGVSGGEADAPLAEALPAPYAVVDPSHERELTAQLGRGVCFVPHVAPSFRGLTVTLSASLARPSARADLTRALSQRYEAERLVRVGDAVPCARPGRASHEVRVGGVSVSDDGGHVAVVAALDDAVTHTASVAIRNVNLALGIQELEGITAWLDG
jgi:N-acetyl-gamma-glutamyl-phosphate reductase